MHVPINVKSPNNISEWRMGFNSAFKGLMWFKLHAFMAFGNLERLMSGGLAGEEGTTPHTFRR